MQKEEEDRTGSCEGQDTRREPETPAPVMGEEASAPAMETEPAEHGWFTRKRPAATSRSRGNRLR